jgi:ribosomal protein S27E
MTTYECPMPRCREEVYRFREVCDSCWEDRRGQLIAIPELYVMTYALLTPGSRMEEIGDIHVDKPESSVPFSLVTFDILEQTHGKLGMWAMWALSRAGLRPGPVAATQGARVSESVSILREMDHRFINTDFAGDYVLDLWEVYRRLVKHCLPTSPRYLEVPCPTCDNTTVITRHADEYATCLTCATEWPHSQLLHMSKGRAA